MKMEHVVAAHVPASLRHFARRRGRHRVRGCTAGLYRRGRSVGYGGRARRAIDLDHIRQDLAGSLRPPGVSPPTTPGPMPWRAGARRASAPRARTSPISAIRTPSWNMSLAGRGRTSPAQHDGRTDRADAGRRPRDGAGPRQWRSLPRRDRARERHGLRLYGAGRHARLAQSPEEGPHAASGRAAGGCRSSSSPKAAADGPATPMR